MRLIALFLIALAACAPRDATVFTRIESDRAFRELIVGRMLVVDQTTLIVLADNTFTIEAPGVLRGGTWAFVDGFWCRTYPEATTVPVEDCQLWELRGDEVRFTRDRGTGEVGRYAIRRAPI